MELGNYPRTLAELEARFSGEQACREYLFQLRWPQGFRCVRRGRAKGWPLSSGRWQCVGCGHQVSVTAGTIFQDTRTPLEHFPNLCGLLKAVKGGFFLRKKPLDCEASVYSNSGNAITIWFRAMWLITSQKNGISALGLQQVLGWGSYQTAWTCLHKLRRAMIRPGRDRLIGAIEADESYVGGVEEGVRGRQTESKALVAVAVEEDGEKIGRVRLRHISDASASNLIPFIQESAEPGSVIHTDGWLGYLPLAANGYEHKITYLKGRKESASELLPRVHRVISLLKRWLLGTHQGGVSAAHLQDYLEEFTFRFNRRKSRSRGKLFYRLAQQAVSMEPTTYRGIVESGQALSPIDHNPWG